MTTVPVIGSTASSSFSIVPHQQNIRDTLAQELSEREKKFQITLNSFNSLSQKGIEIFKNLLPYGLLNEKKFQCSISCPKELLGSIKFIDITVKNQLISQLKEKYPEISLSIYQEDFRYSVEPSTALNGKKLKETTLKVFEVLKGLNFISDENVLNQVDLAEETTFTTLKNGLIKRKVAIQDTQKILDTLFCVRYRSSIDPILLRLTKTNFLDPRILSEMSGGSLTIEKASTLLMCVGIKDRDTNTYVHVMDPKTYYMNQQVADQLNGKHLIELDFISLADVRTETTDPETENIRKHIKDKLDSISNLVNADFVEEFYRTLDDVLTDSSKFTLTNLYNWFFSVDGAQLKYATAFRLKEKPENERSAIEEIHFQIRLYGLDQVFEKIHIYLNDLIQKSTLEIDFDDLSQNCEVNQKLTQAEFSGNSFKDIFNENKHIIYLFLKFSAKKFELPNTTTFEATWTLDGVSILGNYTLAKSTALSIRILLGQADLPYFSENGNSVLKKWKEVAQNNFLEDEKLATYCLELFENGNIQANVEIKELAAFLVILLLGKEPELDQASLLSNFIMLYAVKLGIRTFEQALEGMPIIAGGDVATKQFVLHTTPLRLDSIGWINPSKPVEKSYFLPTSVTYLGAASDWLQKCDDVVTTAIECCVEILKTQESLNENDIQLKELKQILDDLYKMDVPFDDLANALSEERNLMDDGDRVGKWTINYMASLYPLH